MHDFFYFSLKVDSSGDQVLDIVKTEAHDTYRRQGSGTEHNLVLGDTADAVDHTSFFLEHVKLDVLVPEVEIQFNLTLAQNEHTIVNLALLDNLLTGLVRIHSQVDDQFLVSLDIQVSEILNV
jgi:hypothetical protein